MSDTVNTNSTTGASSGDSNATLQAITDLQSQLNDMKGQLNSLTENVDKISAGVASNSNFQTNVQGVDDPYENKRRDRLAYDALVTFALSAAQVGMSNTDLLAKQHMRHADLAVARHWGTSPETANPAGK